MRRLRGVDLKSHLPGSWRQEDHKFKAHLGYKARAEKPEQLSEALSQMIKPNRWPGDGARG